MNHSRKAVAVVLMLMLGSCAVSQVPIHPGAFNRFDSESFDVLLVSQAVIEQARAESIGGTLPEELKPALNSLVDSYNIARDSWLTYRFILASGNTVDAADTKRKIDALTLSLGSFQQARPVK